MKKRDFLKLNLFNDEGDKGGDNQNKGSESNESNTQENGEKDKPETESSNPNDETMFKKFKAWMNSGNEGESKPKKNDKPKDDSEGDKPETESAKKLAAQEERIANIERREALSDLRDAGVPKSMVEDAYSLMKQTGETVDKFLKNRPYFKESKDDNGDSKKTIKPEDKPVSKKNLSAKEKYLRSKGYLK